MKRCGYCGIEVTKGLTFRKSSIDCMESPKLVLCEWPDTPGRKGRTYIRGSNSLPLKVRSIQHSINNPELCLNCQNGLNSLARACREIEQKKA